MTGSGAARSVLAVLDDTRAAEAALDLCLALARLERRELELIYVENAPALAAAALPTTRVLAHGSSHWTAFAPDDVERGWRVQAGRLRRLVEALAQRQAVKCSLQVTRGVLIETTLSLLSRSDLLLVGGAPAALAPARATPAARRVIVAVDDGSAAAVQARRVAAQLAQALPAQLQVLLVDGRPFDAAALPRADLLVLPRSLFTRERLAGLAGPTLLVGAADVEEGR